MSPADFVRLRYDLQWAQHKGEPAPIGTVEKLLAHIEEQDLKAEGMSKRLEQAESEVTDLEWDLRDANERAAREEKRCAERQTEFEHLRKHVRMLESVLREHDKARVEIGALMAMVSKGGEGDG